MIARHVGVQLLLSNFFYKLGEGGDDRDGTIVGCTGVAAGFVDWVDNRVLPGRWKFTGCETGVENDEKDVTDGVET